MKRKWIAALTAMIISVTTAVPQVPLTVQAAPVVQEIAVLYGAATTGAEKDTDGVWQRGANGAGHGKAA